MKPIEYFCNSEIIDKIYVVKIENDYCIGLASNWCKFIFKKPMDNVVDQKDLNKIHIRYLGSDELKFLDDLSKKK